MASVEGDNEIQMGDEPFQATIYSRQHGEIRNMLCSHWSAMWQFCNPSEDVLLEDSHVLQTKAQVARQCFVRLFEREEPYFDNMADMRVVFNRGMRSAADSYAQSKASLETVLAYFEELGMAENASTLQFSASTIQGLSKLLKPYTNGKFSPMVDRIRTQSRCPFLSDGLVLADVPGSEDWNADRTELADTYLLGCIGTIIVAECARAESNTRLRTDIRQAATRYGPGNVIVALTKLDQMERDSATHSLDDVSHLQGLRAELAEATARLDAADDDAVIERDVGREISNLKKEENRIEKVAAGRALVTELEALQKDQPVSFVCISNVEHAQSCRIFKPWQGPSIGPNFDGIKGLRRLVRKGTHAG